MAIRISRSTAQDPTLVAGIYNMCDQWCMYCHATAWCLAYRYEAGAQTREGEPDRDTTDALVDGMLLLRRLWKAEEGQSPDVRALASRDPLQWMHVQVTDPILQVAERYAQLCSAYLRSRADVPFEMRRRPAGPTPLEIVAWHHVLVASKVYRALVSSARAAGGDEGLRRDALASAKVALLGIDRSLEALSTLADEGEDSRLSALQALLRRLQRDVDGRFPGARAFVRPGLDPSERVDRCEPDGR